MRVHDFVSFMRSCLPYGSSVQRIISDGVRRRPRLSPGLVVGTSSRFFFSRLVAPVRQSRRLWFSVDFADLSLSSVSVATSAYYVLNRI